MSNFFFPLLLRAMESPGKVSVVAEHQIGLLDATDYFKSLLAKARPFIVDFPTLQQNTKSVYDSLDPEDVPAFLDMPFPVTWVEYGGDVLVESERPYDFVGALTAEIKPGKYILAQVGVLTDDATLGQEASRLPLVHIQLNSLNENAEGWRGSYAYFKVLCSANHCRWGSERVTIREKLRTKSGPLFSKCSEVIHVRAPGKPPQTPANSSGVIEWHSRWEVRGHWRRRPGDAMGKDRAGIYQIPGATWVREHERGDDSGLRNIKPRIVSGN